MTMVSIFSDLEISFKKKIAVFNEMILKSLDLMRGIAWIDNVECDIIWPALRAIWWQEEIIVYTNTYNFKFQKISTLPQSGILIVNFFCWSIFDKCLLQGRSGNPDAFI